MTGTSNKEHPWQSTTSSVCWSSAGEYQLHFQGRYYEHVEGAAMGSPISPIVANLYMQAFEVQALNTAPHPRSLWRRFVDDMFVVIQSSHKDSLIEHINSIDDRIRFTMEECRCDGSMPILDTLVIPQPDGDLSQCTENQPTLACIFSGTATIPLQQNTVWWAHYIIESEVCVPTPATKEGGRSPTEGLTRKQVPHMGFKQSENEDQYTLKSKP